jgi:hypothetical protein
MMSNLYTSIMNIDVSKEIRTLIAFYFTWITLHYIAPHAYIYLCTPITIIGFLISPFVAATPYCTAIRWIIYESGNMITYMWLSLGTYIASKILVRGEK